MEEIDSNIGNTEQKLEKKSLPKRLLKISLYVVLALIGLNLLLYILLSIPEIQQKAADFAVGELKRTLKTEVKIDELRLSLFNRATLKGVYVEDQVKDTLLYAKSLEATLSPWELVKSKKLAITGITLDNFLINVNKKDSVSDFNFQFIIDAFSSEDTTKTDTTKSALVIVIEDVNLTNGRLNYDILSDTITPGVFNASHIALQDFTANIDLTSIDPDRFDISLNKLSVRETSGIEIRNLEGHLFSEGPQLWVEGLALTLPESHLITNKVRYNPSSDEFEINTNDTRISPKDLVAFLPNLKFLDKELTLNTGIKGTLPSVSIDSIDITYGEDFILRGSAFLESYERYANSNLGIHLKHVKATPTAIESFARLGDSTFISPDILKDLGELYLKGQLTGQLDQFKLDLESWNRLGSLNLLASGKVDSTFTDFDVAAGVKTRNFNLGKLLGADSGLDKLTAHINLKAMQNSHTPLSAQARGAIDAIGFNKDTLDNILLSGYYNAKDMGLTARTDWDTGNISLNASMSQTKVPDIKVQLEVDSLHVDRFYKNENWVHPRLSLALKGDIKGLDVDKMTGLVEIDSLNFKDDNFNFTPGKFTLEAVDNSADSKHIRLKSSLLSATIQGQYTFMALADEFSVIMHDYLPAVFPEPNKKLLNKKKENNFSFSVTANNSEELGKVLGLPVDVVQPATISGYVNTIDKRINIAGNIPHIRFNGQDIQSSALNISNGDSTFNIMARSKVLVEKGDYDVNLIVNGKSNEMRSSISLFSGDTNLNIKGAINANAEFSRNEEKELISQLNILPTSVLIDNLTLKILPAEVVNIGKRTEIDNFGIAVNGKKYFGVDGAISPLESDTLKAYFDHAEIGDLLEAFDMNNIKACLHGDILLTNVMESPELYTEGLEIADIVVYNDTVGTINLDSQWNNDFGGAYLYAALEKGDDLLSEIDGVIYTNQDSLDLQVRLIEMPLKWMQPFLATTLNKLDGSISTNIMIEGSTKSPKLRGFLGFNDTQVGIDYTNVTYTISDTIMISPDRIGFDNLTLKDSKGNTAKVNASVTHKNFDDMKFSLNMQMNKLMVLNTEHRIDSLFYGRVFASGSVKINGDENGINMNMQIKNDKNSKLNILLPQHSEASDYKSVVYINVPEEKLKDKDAAGKSTATGSLPLNLSIKLDVTPDIALGVVINPSTGDAMQAKGQGKITFNYDMQKENMSTYGEYTLTEGNVKLNLQNIKKLQFDIKEGSKLYFNGDPLNTQFDISAYRRVRSDLKSLDVSFDSNDYPSKIDVDCILDISGDIDQMDLSYNISFPNAEDDVRAKVNSYISTDEQKTLQFASLVVTGTFFSSMGNSGSSIGNSLWTGIVSSTLSSRLSALVGNMLGNEWQVGANIESNDPNLTDMNMTVNVSRKFLDDKLHIKTNLGYRTNQSTTADNSFIGDFEAEYRLNSLWTLRAYNHTNDQFYRQAPYTQGVGIVYSKEATSLRRLFQSFRPRRNRNRYKEKEETTSQPSDSTIINKEQQPLIDRKAEIKTDNQ